MDKLKSGGLILKSKNKNRRFISNKISVFFLIAGIITLVLSTFYELQALALTGLGLIFFGALFSFVKPQRYVEGELLNSVSTSIYSTLDRIIRNFKYTGKGYYIPPLPENSNLPSHLKGLSEIVVFISANQKIALPTVEEMSKGKFLTQKSKGVLITPPGSGLITQIEKQMQIDFTNMPLNELCEVLPRSMIENLNLGKSMDLKNLENEIRMEIVDSIYTNLHGRDTNMISLNLIGDPIVSAVACAIAKASSKTVTIKQQTASPTGMALEIHYQIIKG